jgi:hypothetical protein
MLTTEALLPSGRLQRGHTATCCKLLLGQKTAQMFNYWKIANNGAYDEFPASWRF